MDWRRGMVGLSIADGVCQVRLGWGNLLARGSCRSTLLGVRLAMLGTFVRHLETEPSMDAHMISATGNHRLRGWGSPAPPDRFHRSKPSVAMAAADVVCSLGTVSTVIPCLRSPCAVGARRWMVWAGAEYRPRALRGLSVHLLLALGSTVQWPEGNLLQISSAALQSSLCKIPGGGRSSRGLNKRRHPR